MTKAEEVAALAAGTGCLGKSQDNEPVFILVGRDVFAGDIVREWADRVELAHARGGTYTDAAKAKVQEARRLALKMDAWRREHGGKLPE